MNQDLLTRIRALEHQASFLEPAPLLRQQWNQETQLFADEFYDQLEDMPPYVTAENKGEGIKDYPFTETPKELSEILQVIQEHLVNISLNAASGFHFGYVPGGGIFPTALGDYIAAVLNEYAGIFFASPGAVRMENKLLRWMCQMIGYPATALGNLTSGGSIANLIAITTARDQKNIKAEMVKHSVIYLTRQIHHCVQKALRIAGLGEAIIRYIDMDASFKMDTIQLQQQIASDVSQGLNPFLLVGSAGTTDVGAIDPLAAMGTIAQQYDLWFHIDAAYGGFFMLVNDLHPQFRGIELSDSVAIDPHKGFFLSYGLGAILVKDVAALYQSHHYRANYMQDALGDFDELSPADLSPELTKHFRALRMWLPLHLYGLNPFRATLEEKVLLCRYFYEEVQKIGFEVGPFPELSIMIYRYVPSKGSANIFNEKLVKFLQVDGKVFASSTKIEDVFWIRMAVLSFRSHRKHVERCLQRLKEGVAKLMERDRQFS